jgi:large subunit ribosomal protein L19
LVQAGPLHEPAAEAAPAADDEVPGEAVDVQAMEEAPEAEEAAAETAEVEASADAEAAAAAESEPESADDESK